MGTLKQQMKRSCYENERQAREELHTISASFKDKYKVGMHCCRQGRGCYKELRAAGAVVDDGDVPQGEVQVRWVGGWVGGRELQGRRVVGSVAGWRAGG